MELFSPEEWSAIRLSAEIALMCAVLSTPPAIFTGWLLARKRFPGKALAESIICLPLVMPPVTVGYLLLISLSTKSMLGGWLYDEFGIRLAFCFYAAVIASAVVSFPLYVRTVRVAIESGEAKARAVLDLGADMVVDRVSGDLGAQLDACEAEGRPVNVALDCVGGAQLGEHLCKMAQGGRWILIATLGGESSQIPLRPLLKRGLKLIGSTLRGRTVADKAGVVRDLYERVWPALEDGRVLPVVHAVLPIEEAERAHAVLQRQENIGKVVLRFGAD